MKYEASKKPFCHNINASKNDRIKVIDNRNTKIPQK